MQYFTSLYQAATRPHCQRVGWVWSVDETYVRGQGLAVCVPGDRRTWAAEDAKAIFRRSIMDTGVVEGYTAEFVGFFVP